MRTSYNSVSSARRLSSWLMVALGLAAYVGLIYGLTVLPLQLEVPLPPWGILVVPPVVYGLLVLLVVRRRAGLRVARRRHHGQDRRRAARHRRVRPA